MSFNRILLRGPNWVGDSILAIPAMKAIRAEFPGAEITLLVRPWVAGIFTSAPFVDRVWTEPKPSGPGEWLGLARKVRQRAFDLALLFPNSFESALTAFLGRVPHRVGYARDGRGWMLTERLWPAKREEHQVHYYLGLVKAVSASTTQPSTSIEATRHEMDQAAALLASEGLPAGSRFMVLNPGAAYGSAKRWSEEGFADAANRLGTELGLRVVIVGSEAERPVAERINKLLDRPAAILCGKTSLETLIGVLSHATLVITNDSGPMHIAAALGTPTVAVFGSTNEAETGPIGPRTRIVRHHVECSPCMLRECPIDHRCMTRVQSSEVACAAKELLAYA